MNNLLDVVTKGIAVFFFFFRQIDKLYKIFIKQVVLEDELGNSKVQGKGGKFK